MKATNVSKGDWISVGGKPVKVTSVEAGDYLFDRAEIERAARAEATA